MTSLTSEAKAQTIWFDDDDMWIHLYDGRKLAVPLTDFTMQHPNKENILK